VYFEQTSNASLAESPPKLQQWLHYLPGAVEANVGADRHFGDAGGFHAKSLVSGSA